MKFRSQELQQFGESLLTASGLAPDRARDVAEILLEGDLLGHTTHGFALLPAYLNSLKHDAMERRGEPEIVSDCDSSLTWDGNYLPGPWLVRRAIREARERLARHPVATVVIRRSHHIGCLQAYLKPVTDAGIFILLSCSDPNSRTVAPHGGTSPRYSPNPLAVGIPTDGIPILIDISMSTTANGLCQRLATADEKLPGPWLINREGQPTNDPKNLFDGRGGSIQPLGGTDLGYKGFALGLFVEALTNALGGNGRAIGDGRWGASVFLQLINPEKFGGREAFLRETSFFTQACKESPAPPGKPRVRLPGQSALARRAGQLANGVELYPTIFPALIPWAETLKIKLPASL
jgi:L-lactate dehydrogenase